MNGPNPIPYVGKACIELPITLVWPLHSFAYISSVPFHCLLSGEKEKGTLLGSRFQMFLNTCQFYCLGKALVEFLTWSQGGWGRTHPNKMPSSNIWSLCGEVWGACWLLPPCFPSTSSSYWWPRLILHWENRSHWKWTHWSSHHKTCQFGTSVS